MNKYLLILMLSSAATLTLADTQVAQLIHQQRPEDGRTAEQYQADCAAGLSLSACGTIPISKDCGSGRHWSLAGLNYAHCVQDDTDCALGTRLEHDANGNPSCMGIVCPPQQSLVNGICADKSQPSDLNPCLSLCTQISNFIARKPAWMLAHVCHFAHKFPTSSPANPHGC